jgi:hypothetical protein
MEPQQELIILTDIDGKFANGKIISLKLKKLYGMYN